MHTSMRHAVGALFGLVVLASAYILTRQDLTAKINRQPIIQDINSFGYLLRDKGEVKAVTTEGATYNLPGEFHILPSSKWIPQTFNNCGPAGTAMLLQHFGYNVTQAETKSKLRTGDDDSNIFMYEISEYLKDSYYYDYL